MTKEMYATPEMAVVEFGQEDVVVCSDSAFGTGTDSETGGGNWNED